MGVERSPVESHVVLATLSFLSLLAPSRPSRKGTLVAPLLLSGGASSCEEVGRISLPEHNGLEGWPDLGVAPVLAQHIRRVVLSGYVVEMHHTGCDRFPGVVVGEPVVALA